MESDEALYERLLRGEMAAFDRLYDRYERPLFGFIRRQLERDGTREAEDVLHEAFLAVLRERAAGRAATTFRAWLFQVARNLCLNRLRSRRREARALGAVALEPGVAEAGRAPQPERALAHREAAESLRRAVAKLPGPLVEVYQLRAAGMSYDELAVVLAVPLGTVKSRIHEMVRRLREEMER